MPELIPQPDGRGALLSGGMPGNKGGTGRPPSLIRAALRESFDARIQILEEIADGKLYEVKDRIKAMETLAKYGLGTKSEVTGADGAPLNPVVFRERREKADGSPEA
jgi:hypothetical protein